MVGGDSAFYHPVETQLVNVSVKMFPLVDKDTLSQ